MEMHRSVVIALAVVCVCVYVASELRWGETRQDRSYPRGLKGRAGLATWGPWCLACPFIHTCPKNRFTTPSMPTQYNLNTATTTDINKKKRRLFIRLLQIKINYFVLLFGLLIYHLFSILYIKKKNAIRTKSIMYTDPYIYVNRIIYSLKRI